MSHSPDNIIEKIADIILVALAIIFAAIGDYLSVIDQFLGVLVKLTSLASFILFLLINRQKIKEGIVEIWNIIINKK